MSAEAALYALLTGGSPSISAMVGTRVWPDVLPQAPLLPAIRYQRISTPRGQYRTLDGKAEYASPRFQIDIYATSRSQALTIADAVYRLLEGYTGISSGLRIDAISTEDEAGDLDPDVGPGGAPLYRQRLDFIIYHPE
jgi:hypothetical protein